MKTARFERPLAVVATKLPAAVRRAIRSTFSRGLAPSARQLVVGLTVDVPEDILCSIIASSEGQLRLLRRDLKMARIDWRDAVMGGMARRLRRSLEHELRAAGMPVGRARRAVIEALTSGWNMSVTADELCRRIGGRASEATVRDVATVLVEKRWLHLDHEGSYLLRTAKRRRR